jgi:hypothetical protein
MPCQTHPMMDVDNNTGTIRRASGVGKGGNLPFKEMQILEMVPQMKQLEKGAMLGERKVPSLASALKEPPQLCQSPNLGNHYQYLTCRFKNPRPNLICGAEGSKAPMRFLRSREAHAKEGNLSWKSPMGNGACALTSWTSTWLAQRAHSSSCCKE